ncbi:MAG: glycosyltransferase family 2 protein [Candidatus Omnitrophica bacterium]|nr:glycosyltransferase family 2 protein [Candidatus Omnitrophota bacterium]
MKVPLSVVIIAKNEEKQIEECIQSVNDWVDEIVVVDDDSTDKTAEIVSKYTDKIFQRRMDLEGKQRNFGVSKTRNNWVMMLDCDERVTPELKEEIKTTLANPDPVIVGYWVPQINYLGDFQLKHGGWTAPHIRLYNKNHLRWKEIPQDVVHPGIEIDKGYKGGNLQYSLIHYNFASVEDFIKKVNRQSTLEAIKWHISKKNMTQGKAIWRMVDRFFRRFVGKGGWKDGYYGFVGAVLSGFYEFAAYSKLKEIRERKAYLKEYGIKEE